MISERKHYAVDVRFFHPGRLNFYWVILSTVFGGPVNRSLQIPRQGLILKNIYWSYNLLKEECRVKSLKQIWYCGLLDPNLLFLIWNIQMCHLLFHLMPGDRRKQMKLFVLRVTHGYFLLATLRH